MDDEMKCQETDINIKCRCTGNKDTEINIV